MSANNKSYVYIIKAGPGPKDPIKVGVADDVHKRMKQLQTGNPKELRLVMHFECNDREHAFYLEKTIHSFLDAKRMHGEWFKVTKSKLMKVIDNLGKTNEISSLKKEEGIFDGLLTHQARASSEREQKLIRTISSRDSEIADLQLALVAAKRIRGAYVEKLFELGVTQKEIRALKRKAKQ